MGIPKPLSKNEASQEIHAIYDKMTKTFGKMPNVFAMMAHRPEVLKHFVPFYVAITKEGSLDPKYRELAYLKASLINGCEY